MSERSKSRSSIRSVKSSKSIIGGGKSAREDSVSSRRLADPGRFTHFDEAPTLEVVDALPFGDAVAIIITCPQHNKLALSAVDSMKDGLWFPVSSVKHGQSYGESVQMLMERVLMAGTRQSVFKEPRLVHHLRLQAVHTGFVTRMIYYTELSNPIKNESECCASNQIIRWLALTQLPQVYKLWGPEPMEFARQLMTNGAPLLFQQQNPIELTLRQLFLSIHENDINMEGALQVCINDTALNQLYSEFMQQCFPSQRMNLYSFWNYLERSKLALVEDKSQLPSIFRAFSFTMQDSIDIQEFVLGLIALDKNFMHGGAVGALRVGYIYRYYQMSKPSSPNTFHFDAKKFVRDLIYFTEDISNPSESMIQKSLNSLYSTMELAMGADVPIEKFISAIAKKQLRGTSQMFRASKRPIVHIRSNLLYDPDMKPLFGSCARCQAKNFSVSLYHVKMLSDRRIVVPLRNLDHALNKPLSDAPRSARARRKLSQQLFSQNIFNTLLDEIRQICAMLDNVQEMTKFWQKMRNKLYKQFLELLNSVQPVLAKEPRVLSVNSPVYVMGDIHGNLPDLLSFEKMLWPSAPGCLPFNILFLGDYVDRGACSIECAIYLLCLKMLQPERVHLLRGNHEIREIQVDFTFYRECVSKFGNTQGVHLWQRFNEVFDHLPICAIIDEKIFCAHGGMPASLTRMNKVKAQIPCPLPQPESCAVAWEMLWNDPMPGDDWDPSEGYILEHQANIVPPPGFKNNTKRGTAFFYCEEAIDTFLLTNRLSHIIRGHEVKNNGFEFHFGGRVITVFSCSRYCNLTNEAACMLVGIDNKIRPIKLDTTGFLNAN